MDSPNLIRAGPSDHPRFEMLSYLAAVVRGELKISDKDRSSLANNLTVVRILDAARRSAQTRRTISLEH